MHAGNWVRYPGAFSRGSLRICALSTHAKGAASAGSLASNQGPPRVGTVSLTRDAVVHRGCSRKWRSNQAELLPTNTGAIRTQETFSEERASPETSVILQKSSMLVVDADCFRVCQGEAKAVLVVKVARIYQRSQALSRRTKQQNTLCENAMVLAFNQILCGLSNFVYLQGFFEGI